MTSGPPTEDDVRRVLDHLMSPGDIDAAIGWARGTATKSRRSRHGLPEPLAYVGGTPVWLRSTIEVWRAGRLGRGAGGGRPWRAVAPTQADSDLDK